MENKSVFDVLVGKIREYMNEGADHLSTGGAKNFEDYQRLVGRIEGLAIMEREVLALADKTHKM